VVTLEKWLGKHEKTFTFAEMLLAVKYGIQFGQKK
jgi:hypothetical protein